MSDKTSLRDAPHPLDICPKCKDYYADCECPALARSEAQGESDRVTWNLLYQELRAAIDNGNESMTHAEALEWIADQRNTPADRAPGEVLALVDQYGRNCRADGYAHLDGDNTSTRKVYRELLDAIRRLAARAPSAQGEEVGEVSEGWSGHARAVIWKNRQGPAPGTKLYTSAPAAGDGECPACRGTGMELDGSGRAIPREWCEKCDGEGRTP